MRKLGSNARDDPVVITAYVGPRLVNKAILHCNTDPGRHVMLLRFVRRRSEAVRTISSRTQASTPVFSTCSGRHAGLGGEGQTLPVLC